MTDFNEPQAVLPPGNYQDLEQAVTEQSANALKKQLEPIIEHYQHNEFDRAIELLEAIRDDDNPIWRQVWCPDLQYLLATCYVNLGIKRTVAQEKLHASQQAITLLEAIRDHDVSAWRNTWCANWQLQLVQSYNNRHMAHQSSKEQIQTYQQIIVLLEAIRDHNDSTWHLAWRADLQQLLAKSYYNIAMLIPSSVEKVQALQQAIMLLEAIRDHNTPSWHQAWCADWQQVLALCYLKLGTLPLSSQELVQVFQQVIVLLEAIRDHNDPAWYQTWCADWQHLLAQSYNNLGTTFSPSSEEKVLALQQAITQLEAIRDHNDPAWYQTWCADWQYLLGLSHFNLGVAIAKCQPTCRILHYF